jgi:hypothetical protein
MRSFGWLGAILALMLILVAGGIGFAIGTSSVIPVDAAGAVVTAPVAWGWHGWGFGAPFFPFFGLLFVILLFVFIGGIARRAAWGGPRGGGPRWDGPRFAAGPWGAGPWGPDDPRARMFEEWHRQAHGGPSAGQSVGGPSEAPSTSGSSPDDQAATR